MVRAISECGGLLAEAREAPKSGLRWGSGGFARYMCMCMYMCKRWATYGPRTARRPRPDRRKR